MPRRFFDDFVLYLHSLFNKFPYRQSKGKLRQNKQWLTQQDVDEAEPQ